MSGASLDDEWIRISPPAIDLSSRVLPVKTAYGPLRIAFDSDGSEHLLIPVMDGYGVPTDRNSRGVMLVAQELQEGSETIRFADLVCTEQVYSPVFRRLVEDVVGRIDESDEPPVAELVRTLDQWRDLFRNPRPAVDMWRVRGLIGELFVLAALLELEPAMAVQTWTGPSNSKHDFQSDYQQLEVKTTSSASSVVSMNGIGQLDADRAPLMMILVRTANKPDGSTVSELVEMLIGLGAPVGDLESKLSELGFDRRVPDEWDKSRWTLESMIGWDVDDAFPGLRSSDIGQDRLRGVRDISYSLDLDVAGDALGEEGLDIRFRRLFGQDVDDGTS